MPKQMVFHISFFYQDPGTFSIFPNEKEDEGGWIAREDYQLLDAIEQFGYGNWEDVAKHVETRDSESTLHVFFNLGFK